MVYDGMNFGEKLAILIDLRNTSQSALSRKSGVGQPAISEMIKGERRPKLEQGFLLAKALEVPLEFLADDEMEEIPIKETLEDERIILRIARELGSKEAIRRLSKAHEPPHFIKEGEQEQDSIKPKRRAGS